MWFSIYLACFLTGLLRFLASEKTPDNVGIVLNMIAIWFIIFGGTNLTLMSLEALMIP